MKDDLISRQAAIKLLEDWADGYTYLEVPVSSIAPKLNELLTAEKGKWIYDEERGATGIYAICTACNEMIYQTGEFNYCPNCGARMEGHDGL